MRRVMSTLLLIATVSVACAWFAQISGRAHSLPLRATAPLELSSWCRDWEFGVQVAWRPVVVLPIGRWASMTQAKSIDVPMGVAHASFTRWPRMRGRQCWVFRARCSLWFATIAVSGAWVYTWRRRFRATTACREERGSCTECGYDLTGNESGVCPECGSDVEA